MRNFIFYFFYFLSLQFCYSQITKDSLETQNNKTIFPELNDFVNDNEKILKNHEKAILNTTLENFYKNHNHKIIIVTVSSIFPYENIFHYSLEMANYSNTEKQLNTEIMIVLSKNLKEIQIQNSDLIRNILTDDETKNILETFILPEFKKENYFKGLKKGISEIKKELE